MLTEDEEKRIVEDTIKTKTRYDKLNKEQQQAVFHTEGPVLILAGAGSGKTRVLTHRIEYLIEEKKVAPWHILAITFTNKAAREMRERAENLAGDPVKDAWICTFHSACIRILKRCADRLGYDSRFTIYDPEDQKAVVRRLLKELNLSDKMFTPKAILAEISRAKDELKSPSDYKTSVGAGDLFRQKVSLVYEAYQKNLIENNAMDFDDIINKTVELFRDNPDVLDYYQEKFTYIMVDEYQDTNTAQYMLIRLLSSKYRNLCVVGDDDQSIYRFRGANIRNILDFEKDFKDALVIRLEQNYRSTSKILEAANQVIRNNSQRKSKTLWTRNPEGDNITVHCEGSDNEEAAYVASTIQTMVENGQYHYKDIALLFRTNAQSRALEEKLVVSAIPYHLFGGIPFYQRKEVKDILCYLRLVANDHDYVAAQRIINVPARAIGDVTFEHLRAFAEEGGFGVGETCDMSQEIGELARSSKKLQVFGDLLTSWREKADTVPISKLIHSIIEDTGYSAYLMKDDPVKYEDRMDNLMELSDRADQYTSENEEATLDGFLDELSLVSAIDSWKERDDTVALMTLHSAKGLEFPVVFMTGMEDGLFPSFMSISSGDEDDLEEERRLCYVGITRAQKKLYLTWAQSRRINGQVQPTTKSRFLKELPQEILDEEEEEDTFETGNDFNSRAYAQRSYASYHDRTDQGAVYAAGHTMSFAAKYAQRARDMEKASAKAQFAQPKANGFSVQDTAPSDQIFKVGDAVKHRIFGLGTVTEVKWVNTDYQVRVNFAKVGEKLLFAKLARLEKV